MSGEGRRLTAPEFAKVLGTFCAAHSDAMHPEDMLDATLILAAALSDELRVGEGRACRRLRAKFQGMRLSSVLAEKSRRALVVPSGFTVN